MQSIISKTPEKGAQNKSFEIIINGRPYEWHEKEISFEQVISLAFGPNQENDQTVYTMTYKRGQGNKTEGEMANGDSVKVKDKMIFNVTSTDKS